MSLFLLRSPGGSLFPGILRIAASVTPEAAKAAETHASEAAELAKAALEGNEAPTLLPPLKSAAAVAASELNASPLFSRVAVAVPVGYTELLVFVHKVSRTKRREKRRRKRPRSERVFFSLSLSPTALSSSQPPSRPFSFLFNRRKRPASTRHCCHRARPWPRSPSELSRIRSAPLPSRASSSRSSPRRPLRRRRPRRAGTLSTGAPSSR